MAVKRGTDGLIEVSDDGGTSWKLVASQQNWSLDQSNDTIDTTVLGAQRDRDNITTFRSWNINVDGFWDDNDLGAEGQGIVQAHMASGDPLDIRITPAATNDVPETTGDWFYSGQANVASNSPSGGFDTAIQNSMTFEGKFALTFAQFP